MFVQLPNAYGVLTAPLRQTGLVIAVDDALKSILDSLAGNHTYLAIYTKDKFEVVKVFAIDMYGVHIVRAQDNTEAYSFNIYDKVRYVSTAAAIEDTIPEITLTLVGKDAIAVEGYNILYPDISIEVLGASQIVGDNSYILIGRKEDAYGCCDGDNNPAPIPAVPFYLTSQPYPIESVESFTYTGSILGGRLWTPPAENITYTGSILPGGTLRTLLQQLPPQPPEAITYTASIGRGGVGDDGGTLVQVLKSLPSQPYEAISYTADILPAGGSLTVILRTYTNWPYDAVTYTGDLLSGTLT